MFPLIEPPRPTPVYPGHAGCVTPAFPLLSCPVLSCLVIRLSATVAVDADLTVFLLLFVFGFVLSRQLSFSGA